MARSPLHPRVLLTGGDGFVGHHTLRVLAETLPPGSRLTSGEPAVDSNTNEVERVALDVTDAERVGTVVREISPTHVLHLAAISSAALAEKNQRRTWEVNLFGTLNLIDAIKQHVPYCRLIHASSVEVYGASFLSGEPLDETALLRPVNAYASSKAAADLLVGQMAAEGLNAIRVRPVNHTGPGQSENFVVPAFAAQLARIECGLQASLVRVGNLDDVRDFLDVRDVARLYAQLVAHTGPLEEGLVLNVGSGVGRRIGDILERLMSMSGVSAAIEKDESRERRHGIHTALVDATSAATLVGWRPEIRWDDTLRSVLDYWRGQMLSLGTATSPPNAQTETSPHPSCENK